MAHRVEQITSHLRPRAESRVYDVVIVGVGAMGVSAAYHLAKGGQSVLGLERYSIAHANGSSHGETRITRLAYWEHPAYVPLLRRSFELWSELEAASGAKLFHRTGSLDIGPEDEATFAGSVLSCKQHGLEHEILTPADLAARFPAWTVPANYRACFQPAGGMLLPERIVEATARLARAAGADLRENTEVIDVAATGDGGVVVRTASGEVFRARRLILSPGAWLSTLLAKSTLGVQSPRIRSIGGMLRPERQVVTWYGLREGAEAAFQPERHPVWIATFEGAHYYGFPLLKEGSANGAKIGRYHHAYEMLESESSLNDLATRQKTHAADRTYTDAFMQHMFGGRVAADAHDPILKDSTCMFTNTPDEHFIVDPSPDSAFPQVSLISACSGHGFKFSSVLGEVMARFILDGREKVERDLPVAWLDAGRLLGDRPPMQPLDPHIAMDKKQV